MAKFSGLRGYTCSNGKKYAKEEHIVPKRMVTALMCMVGSRQPLTVKTSHPIEKSKIFDCLKEIRSHAMTLPITIGEVLFHGVCGTDVGIIATKELF